MQNKHRVFLKDACLAVAIFGGLAWSFVSRWNFSFLAAAILAGMLTPVLWLARLVSKEFSK